jgi:hypothetical protein
VDILVVTSQLIEVCDQQTIVTDVDRTKLIALSVADSFFYWVLQEKVI